MGNFIFELSKESPVLHSLFKSISGVFLKVVNMLIFSWSGGDSIKNVVGCRYELDKDGPVSFSWFNSASLLSIESTWVLILVRDQVLLEGKFLRGIQFPLDFLYRLVERDIQRSGKELVYNCNMDYISLCRCKEIV